MHSIMEKKISFQKFSETVSAAAEIALRPRGRQYLFMFGCTLDLGTHLRSRFLFHQIPQPKYFAPLSKILPPNQNFIPNPKFCPEPNFFPNPKFCCDPNFSPWSKILPLPKISPHSQYHAWRQSSQVSSKVFFWQNTKFGKFLIWRGASIWCQSPSLE